MDAEEILYATTMSEDAPEYLGIRNMGSIGKKRTGSRTLKDVVDGVWERAQERRMVIRMTERI